jgi:hypothetical protein
VNCVDRDRPVRVSVDLIPDAYAALRRFAFDAEMTHADVVRALVALLEDDEVADRVREEGR